MRSREPGRSRKNSARRFAAGGIDGLHLVWTDASTVTVQVGECRDSTDSYDMELTSTQAVAIGSSGAAGLDTGSESSGTATWYYVYLIAGDAGTSAVFSTNASAPTLPTGYQYYRRIGAVMNWTDNDIQKFTMTGKGRTRTTWWNELPANFQKALDNGVSNGSWAEVSVANFVSPKASEMYLRATASAGTTNNNRVKAKDYSPAGASGTNTTQMIVAQNYNAYNVMWLLCDTDKAFEHYADNSACRLTVSIRAYREIL